MERSSTCCAAGFCGGRLSLVENGALVRAGDQIESGVLDLCGGSGHLARALATLQQADRAVGATEPAGPGSAGGASTGHVSAGRVSPGPVLADY